MEITATEFKAKCLRLMDQVAKTREPIVITKRGKPVATLAPIEGETKSLFGYMKGTLAILGDIVLPVAEKWSAMEGDEDALYGDLGVSTARVGKQNKRGKRQR